MPAPFETKEDSCYNTTVLRSPDDCEHLGRSVFHGPQLVNDGPGRSVINTGGHGRVIRTRMHSRFACARVGTDRYKFLS